jgi:hypothetical protein
LLHILLSVTSFSLKSKQGGAGGGEEGKRNEEGDERPKLRLIVLQVREELTHLEQTCFTTFTWGFEGDVVLLLMS